VVGPAYLREGPLNWWLLLNSDDAAVVIYKAASLWVYGRELAANWSWRPRSYYWWECYDAWWWASFCLFNWEMQEKSSSSSSTMSSLAPSS